MWQPIVIQPAVEVIDLAKRYGDLVALDAVSLTVDAGEVHGLLGPNGAGKTTLMRTLFGLIRPDSGELRVFGHSVPDNGVAALREVGGFIESPRFYPYLSARRNLELLARLDLTPRASSRVADVLSQTGLSSRADDRVREYSFGMQQRLGIAASLLRSPKLLVVDEPSNGLDPGGIRDMRQLIKDLAASGLTILISSHNMLEIDELCDHVTIIRRGEVAFHGSLSALHRRAPEPARLLCTADDVRAAEAMRAVPGVDRLEVTDAGVRFHASAPSLDSATIRLGEMAIGIRSLTSLEAPLETLFFMLTDDSSRQAVAV